MADNTEILVEISQTLGHLKGTIEQMNATMTANHQKIVLEQDNQKKDIQDIKDKGRRIAFTLTGFSLAGGFAGTKLGAIITGILGGGN